MVAARHGVSHGQSSESWAPSPGSRTRKLQQRQSRGINQTPCQTLPSTRPQPQELLATLGDIFWWCQLGEGSFWYLAGRGQRCCRGHPCPTKGAQPRRNSAGPVFRPSRVCAVMVTRGHQGSFASVFCDQIIPALTSVPHHPWLNISLHLSFCRDALREGDSSGARDRSLDVRML